MEMKTCVLLTLLTLCCPLVLVAGDFEDFLGAMIIGSMIGVSESLFFYDEDGIDDDDDEVDDNDVDDKE